MRAIRYVSLAIWLFAEAQTYGQFPTRGNTSEFRGRLTEGNGLSYDGYVVEVSNVTDRSITERTDVLADGSFVFRAIPDGDYTVRVNTLYGAEITTSVASVGQMSTGSTFEIRLPQAKLQKPVSGTVSMQQLSHPLSKQVRKLLESGRKAVEEQHFSDAAARFREAAQSDPQCSQAHAELALALAKMEVWDSAIEEYRAATSLDPRNSTLHSNLSAVLASAKRFDEAESEASAALKLDPGNARAHFVLAGALIRTHGKIQEVVSHLVSAQDAFPSARLVLGQICAQKNVRGCP